MTAPTEKYWVLDRFEGELAILTHATEEIAVPRSTIPAPVEEGDVFTASGDAEVGWLFTAAPTETARRLGLARARLARLRTRDPGSDLDL